MSLEIEKGRPIPPPPRGRLTRELKETFALMEVGDSFRLPTRSRQTLNQVTQELGVEVEVRLLASELRVWLIRS